MRRDSRAMIGLPFSEITKAAPFAAGHLFGCTDLLRSRQQLTELLDRRQLAGTDLIVLAVRGFGDPLSDGDEPFVHLAALIRRQ
jgi:hypothetical protein